MLRSLNEDTEIKDWEKASEFGNWVVSDDFPRLFPRGGVEAKFADRGVKSGKGGGEVSTEFLREIRLL